MPNRELLIPWLNDAYAMENAFVQLFVNHARDVEESHPLLHARLLEQVETARAHAEQLHGCLARLGAAPSILKTGLGSLVGALEAVSMDTLTSEAVHDVIADYTAIGYGIGAYKALIVAAEDCDDYETSLVCRQILREEEETARWLEMQIPPLAVEAVKRDAGVDDERPTGFGDE
jgi:ferritin-like metal-binding protein YciE